MAHPHAYEWHDGHTGHHTPLALAKADGVGKPHPHMDAPPAPQPQTPHPTNDQAAGVGVSTYAQFAKPYGEIHPGHKSDLNFYPMHGKLDAVKNLVGAHGYQTYYAGGQFGKPDLASKNYNTKHLMVYDPTPSSGGDFGDHEYTDAWRNIHELAHANVYPELNSIYGEGRRIGKLGIHRTLHEAKRAVHWEWLAAHRQRQLAESIGIKIPDEAFHKELNTVMHDAVHRAVTGKFTEPSGEGFVPHAHKVPLQQAMSLLDEAARNLGLHNPHQLLRKSEDSMTIDPTVAEKLRVGILGQLKKAVAELETHYSDMRERELRKSEMEKCGDMSGKPVAKGELKDAKTVPSYEAKPDKPKDDSVLPGDKKSKDLSDKDTGAGGQQKKGKMAKADLPMGAVDKRNKLLDQLQNIRAAHMQHLHNTMRSTSPTDPSAQRHAQDMLQTMSDISQGEHLQDPAGAAAREQQAIDQLLALQRTRKSDVPMAKSAKRPDGPYIPPRSGGEYGDDRHVRLSRRADEIAKKYPHWPEWRRLEEAAKSMGNDPSWPAGSPDKGHVVVSRTSAGNHYMTHNDKGHVSWTANPAEASVMPKSVADSGHASMSMKGAKGLEVIPHDAPINYPRAMAKSDVPMAKPPTKSPTAPPSTSKPAPAPAAPPAATGTETKKAEVPMAKAGPRLGGKDMMSQAMTNDAAKAGMGAPAAPKIPGRAPKMSQEDHARRAAEMAAFTPSGAFSEPKGQGAAAGAMKPGAPASSGLELAPKAPAPKSPGIKIPGRG